LPSYPEPTGALVSLALFDRGNGVLGGLFIADSKLHELQVL